MSISLKSAFSRQPEPKPDATSATSATCLTLCHEECPSLHSRAKQVAEVADVATPPPLSSDRFHHADGHFAGTCPKCGDPVPVAWRFVGQGWQRRPELICGDCGQLVPPRSCRTLDRPAQTVTPVVATAGAAGATDVVRPGAALGPSRDSSAKDPTGNNPGGR